MISACLHIGLNDVNNLISVTIDQDEPDRNEAIPFEIVVMENALYAVTHKFNQNLSRMKQLFNVLIECNIGDPCQSTLEKLFALKKTLVAFESR